MTINDLIQHLIKLDGNAEVKIWSHSGGCFPKEINGKTYYITPNAYTDVRLETKDIIYTADQNTNKKYLCIGHDYDKDSSGEITLFMGSTSAYGEDEFLGVKPAAHDNSFNC